jgi:hypothetical protein
MEALAGEQGLQRRRKGDLEKGRLAKQVRTRTLVNLKVDCATPENGKFESCSDLLAQEDAKKCKKRGQTSIRTPIQTPKIRLSLFEYHREFVV